MIEPVIAPVRPRVRPSDSDQTILLEEAVGELVERNARGGIAILGPGDCGKTTAINHLAALFPPSPRILYFDGDSSVTVANALRDHPESLVIFSSASLKVAPHKSVLNLVKWTLDDCIEYVLQAQRHKANTVIARVGKAVQTELGGNPRLCRLVIDELAMDDSVDGPSTVLQRWCDRLYADSTLWPYARRAATGIACGLTADDSPSARRFALTITKRNRDVAKLLRYRVVAAVVTARWLVDCLLDGRPPEIDGTKFPLEVVELLAQRIKGAQGRHLVGLRDWLTTPQSNRSGFAAGVLHRIGEDQFLGKVMDRIRFPYRAELDLNRAFIDGLDVSRKSIRKTTFDRASVRECRLVKSKVVRCTAQRADFSNTLFTSGKIARCHFEHCDFSEGSFSEAKLRKNSFTKSTFCRADFTNVSARNVDFTGSDFRDCNFIGSEWVTCKFRDAKVAGADFTRCRFFDCNFSGLPLYTATLNHAVFENSDLTNCDLEYVELAGVSFVSSKLTEAQFTGSSLPGANFEKATMLFAKLAEVNWEGVNLRGTNLAGATFHMGSSRSGLVHSDIACEGSRTGFYTDDYFDRPYKAPEEIRKANLRNADLRGAYLGMVDFYLVDLRGALLDPDQRDHVRKCGAILDSRDDE